MMSAQPNPWFSEPALIPTAVTICPLKVNVRLAPAVPRPDGSSIFVVACPGKHVPWPFCAKAGSVVTVGPPSDCIAASAPKRSATNNAALRRRCVRVLPTT